MNKSNGKSFSGGGLNFAQLYKESTSKQKVKNNDQDTHYNSSEKDLQKDGNEQISEIIVDQKNTENSKNLESSYPLEKSIKLKGHTRAVTALDWDASGSRLLTGGYDYLIKFWNFAAMDSSLRSFREIEPVEGCQINDLRFSLTGDVFLAIAGSPQARLFDRDGSLLNEYKRGDMYLRDMRHTSGHVSPINSCFWNPTNKKEFLTAASDSTVRIWDVDYHIKQKSVLVMKTKERGGKTSATSSIYSPDGKSIVTAQQDGCISIWSSSGTLSRPKMHLENAHSRDTPISCLLMDSDGNRIHSKSGDGTIKVWDIRSFKVPISERSGIHSTYPQANMEFSPDGKLIVTASEKISKKSSKNEIDSHGGSIPHLIFLNSQNLEIVHTQPINFEFDSESGDPTGVLSGSRHVGAKSLIKVLWHKELNQIAVTSSTGFTQIYFDMEKSIKGAKLCAFKPAKYKKTGLDGYSGEDVGRIITPHALPLFKDSSSSSTKRRTEKLRKDPIASRRPELPVRGQGRGGVIGTSETQHIMKSLIKDTTRDEDPREALLRHAAAAADSPYWVAPAYKKHQPEPIFDETGMKDEPELKRRK
ncbi:hypothetical protein BB558_005021 [Smittium angustum]|uniref:Uncharacterized protein n=1 Tax=Smittium angustum TaxID=133377 RepID=A0A2U1J1M2_SMIAN|nr:hypothetical protein BB558_005021 [Smittium angustum]